MGLDITVTAEVLLDLYKLEKMFEDLQHYQINLVYLLNSIKCQITKIYPNMHCEAPVAYKHVTRDYYLCEWCARDWNKVHLDGDTVEKLTDL